MHNNPSLLKQRSPIIWALMPYCIEAGTLKGEAYDFSAYKVEMALVFQELNLPWIMQIVLHSTLDSVIAQIVECSKLRPTLVFNLCDGYDEMGMPGVSVVKALEAAKLPFTGADTRHYETSSSKILMKELFRKASVPTAGWEVLPDSGPVTGLCQRMGQRLIIKPDSSAGSFGIGLKSVVNNDADATTRRDELKQSDQAKLFPVYKVFAEEFIEGPEFTVLIGGYWDNPEGIWCLPPAERIFDASIPENERFLSYDRYWGFYKEETPPENGRPFYAYRLVPPEQAAALVDTAKRAYVATWGYNYGRVDIRLNKKINEYQVLEVNANCGLSGDTETSCGSILGASGQSFASLIETILEQALAHSERLPPGQ